MITTQNYQMEVPKEFKEVADLVIGITKHLMEKKPLSELVAMFPQALQAVEGYEEVLETVKSDYRDEALAYLIHQLMPVLAPVEKTEAPAAE